MRKTKHTLYGLDFVSAEPCTVTFQNGYLQIDTKTKQHIVKSNVPWPTLISKLKELGITLNPPL
jgi:hypothetical protein